MGKEIWFQNRVVSDFFLKVRNTVLCNSSKGGGREGTGEEGVRSKMEKRLGSEIWKAQQLLYNQQVSAATTEHSDVN